MSLRAWMFAVATVLGGCSTISNTVDSLNPFSKAPPKVKPADLAPLKPAIDTASLWQASIGSAGAYTLAPAVAGNSVYVASNDGALARFDNGRQVWRIAVGQKVSGGVGANDRLVVVGSAKGEVLAFNAADGSPAWQARTSSEILAAPALQGDLVAVRSGDARIFGFAAADGKRRWVYQRSTPALALRSHVGVAMTDKAVFAGFPGGKLVAVSPTNGAALWESAVALPRGATELERIADIVSDPVVEGGMVCAVAYQGRVACFDVDNGRQLWTREISSTAGLDIGRRAVYVADDKGAVQAFERGSGVPLWKQDKLFMRGLSTPLVQGSRIAIADYQGIVHWLAEEDGVLVGRFATDGSAITATPRRLGDDRFVVQTRNGGVYALTVR